MFSLFPVVLDGLVGLLPSLSAPVQGQGGLQLQPPSGLCGRDQNCCQVIC